MPRILDLSTYIISFWCLPFYMLSNLAKLCFEVAISDVIFFLFIIVPILFVLGLPNRISS